MLFLFLFNQFSEMLFEYLLFGCEEKLNGVSVRDVEVRGVEIGCDGGDLFVELDELGLFEGLVSWVGGYCFYGLKLLREESLILGEIKVIVFKDRCV